jgi:hypothetical protein
MSQPATLTKKCCYLFGFLFLISIPVVWSSLFFTSYHGDLTRVGKWMESDFAANSPQPLINERLLISSSLREADILVIGDSFSENLHWQATLTQDNKKVATILWSQIDQICEDFPERLRASGFHGKQIIVESIERIAARQFDKSAKCKTGIHFTDQTTRSTKPIPAVITSEKNFNINGQFIAGLETIIHSLAIRATSYYPKLHNYKSKGSHIYPIANGCDYFSNRLCQFGLFFHEDYSQPGLDQKTIADIQILKKRLGAYQTTWVVIPNKSSIYQRPTSKDFWESLHNSNLGPNLYQTIQTEKFSTKDIYAPNDTHFSTKGYLLLGSEVKKFLNLNSSKKI